MQLVSRIARTIGKTLNLNLDLIEAIALGHDLGHTPFGHTGEKFLDQVYFEHTGRHFAHNVHSVRVLDKIFPLNVSLQTLDGVACHNGEMELDKFLPTPIKDFETFDKVIENCYVDSSAVKKLIPATLEGSVVRISDIIAYLGKDRHDAEKSKVLKNGIFTDFGIGTTNSEIINNLMVNIIENSYGKPYIKMDKDHFDALKQCKAENYKIIYANPSIKHIDGVLKDMMFSVYDKLLQSLEKSEPSPIFNHHIKYINKPYYKRATPYEETEKNQIVVDYIASMTDDYFIELFHKLFPQSSLDIKYVGYFD